MGGELIMAPEPRSQSELSPLDQIRQAEAQVARQIATAREAAKQTVAKNKKQG
jgi:vacuolar-type H+-ATPase subunit H